jgi:glycosyltransferase involved in cell wall biosynthesis
MTAIYLLSVPKIKSYGRDPMMKNIKKAVSLSRRGSMVFTGCSDYITRQIQTEGEAYTIYNSVPIERYTPVYSTEEDAPLVFLGRIEDAKGTHIAVEVARKTNRRLVIAGNISPGYEGYFERTVKPYVNRRIQYVGPVNDAQKNELLGKAAAFLMPIQWNEPFGIVMAEAMACGTPVLAFPYGSVPEVIQDGVNGFICMDVEEMERKIADVGSLDRRTVRRIVEERFSNDTIVEEYLRLYEALVERRRTGHVMQWPSSGSLRNTTV